MAEDDYDDYPPSEVFLEVRYQFCPMLRHSNRQLTSSHRVGTPPRKFKASLERGGQWQINLSS